MVFFFKMGLGEDFSLEVNATVQNILSYADAWPIVEDDVKMPDPSFSIWGFIQH